ncbi:MAG TPA: hypothetical protein VGL71_03855 [Urbifossiella sp.]|jgi:hypothetical protein
MTENDFPHAEARRWVEEFAEFLGLSVALRALVLQNVSRHALRRTMTTRAAALVAAAEELEARGYRPGLGLAGAEADLWAQTVRYASEICWLVPPAGVPANELQADLAAMQAAWRWFENFVKDLPENFSRTSAVLASGTELRGESLAELFRPRIAPTAIVG